MHYEDEVNLDPFNETTSWNTQYDFHDLEKPYQNE